MNSAEDLQQNVNDSQKANVIAAPSSPDNNANALARPANKKTGVKLNNNIENMSTLNSPDELARFNDVTGSNNRIPSENHSNERIEASCSNHQNEATSDSEPENLDSEAETELMSGSDDGCIYTYKGDHAADLPNSFFYIPPPDPPVQNVVEDAQHRQEASSPEMDFLEMDFDPSNNGDIDSASDNEYELKMDTKDAMKQRQDVIPCPTQVDRVNGRIDVSIDPGEGPSHAFNGTESVSLAQESIIRQTFTEDVASTSSLGAGDQSIAATYRVAANAKQRRSYEGFVTEEESEARMPVFESAMIWSAEEALLKETTIIDGANCAATAVFNVLTALRIPISSVERIAANTHWRRHTRCPTLAKYLLSKSQAGSTHQDIIKSLHESSNGAVEARFFPMHPERVINFTHWLAFWIKNGVVPIATLNMEHGMEPIAHAWHHQMIYGVDEKGVFLMNPYKYIETELIWPQLSSDSVLKVQRSDILARWNLRTDLLDLMRIDDVRWQRINVVGQVANMIHESHRPLRLGLSNTSYIRIPSIYAAGITLSAIINTPGWHLLNQARELPILAQSYSEASGICRNSVNMEK